MIICSSYQAERHVTSDDSGSNVTLYEGRYGSSLQGSPPSYSRLPPDGHEFPTTCSERFQDKNNRITEYSSQQEVNTDSSVSRKVSNISSPSALPRSPHKLSSTTPSSDGRSNSRWRRQDEKSERSVKDKIAMFSSEKERSKGKNRKIDRSESVNEGSIEKMSMKRSLTEDDVRIESDGMDVKLSRDSSVNSQSSRKQGKATVYSSMINVHSSGSDSKENVKPASSEADLREKNSKNNPHPKSAFKTTGSRESISGLNSRSQSLIDIGKPSRLKRHSVGAYDRPSVYKYGVEKPEDRERRTSLNNMIEQRRKSMSKLRALVIPKTRNRDTTEARLPLDLPRISSHAPQSYKTMSLPRDESRVSSLYKADSVSSIDSCSSSTSKHSSTPSSHSGKGIRKCSPIHSRKHSCGTSKSDSLPPLSSRALRNQSQLNFSGSASTLTSVSPQRSLDRSYNTNSDNTFEMDIKYSTEQSVYSRSSLKTSQDSRINRNEDSDNDSAVSSTLSSFSQSISPRASPMPDHYDNDDQQSSTHSTMSCHSRQSSYDELEPKRVLKSGSIEAENRRNVLKSAKCSSGRSSDEQSTPEIVRKFSNDQNSQWLTDKLDSELSERRKKTHLRREGSVESSSSISSLESSRRNSRDSVIHVSSKMSDIKVSAQAVYFDREGDMYKDSEVKVAYLNEIIDDYDNLPADKGNVITEIPLHSKTWREESLAKSNVTTAHSDEKWNVLGNKYSSSKADHERIEDKTSKYVASSESLSFERSRYGVSTTKTGFRALADKWKQRTEEDLLPGQRNLAKADAASKIKRKDSLEGTNEARRLSRSENSVEKSLRYSSNSSSSSSSCNSIDDIPPSPYQARDERPKTLNISRTDVPDRKFSVPEYGSGLKLRERREGNSGDISSRPTSLIEGSNAMETLQQDGQYMTALSSSISTDSREDLLDSSEESLSRTGSKEVLDAFLKVNLSTCVSPKMSEIMRAFERHDMSTKGLNALHPRMSSMDSNGSDDGFQGAHYGSASSLASGQRDQYGSITSLSSSTSIISPQELAQLIEEANYSLEESGTPSHEILVVVLHREIVGHGSIGITLAGGADYETKEITVHKVIPGSLADRDGRIQKGDRVLSINGRTLRGVSHREALNILKSPRPEVVLVLSRSRSVTPQESTATQSSGDTDGGFSHRSVFINHVPPPRPPKILESPMDSKSLVSDLPAETVQRGPPLNVTLLKDGAGLGFSLEGGKDSPLGDRPLTIKKVFSGGAADKGGVLKVGDELLSVNSVDLTKMARIEAWNFLKKLPDGKVSLVIRQKLKEEDKS